MSSVKKRPTELASEIVERWASAEAGPRWSRKEWVTTGPAAPRSAGRPSISRVAIVAPSGANAKVVGRSRPPATVVSVKPGSRVESCRRSSRPSIEGWNRLRFGAGRARVRPERGQVMESTPPKGAGDRGPAASVMRRGGTP